MGFRALLALDERASSDIACMAVDVATDIARRCGVSVTITTSEDGRFRHDVDLRRHDLVHVIGAPVPAMLTVRRAGLPLVVTPTAQPRRVSVPLFVLRRRAALATTRWLVHGRGAAARIVGEGMAPGSRVLPLPVLPYLDIAAHEWAARRAESREALGVSPGCRVVVAIGATGERAFPVFRQAMNRFSRQEILPLWIATDGRAATGSTPSADDVPVVTEALGRRLLTAMDVLVATGVPFAARSAAVDAASVGVPVISTPSDVAADFVDLAAGGSFLPTLRPAELAAAVANTWRTTRRRPPSTGAAADREDVIALTQRCYADALGRPLTGTTTLLNGRSA